MKTLKVGTKAYEICESLVESSADRIVEVLATAQNATQQQMAIDTMHSIINRNPEKYAAYSRGTSLAAQIRQEQRAKIEKWGDKAFTLSEKQLGVIAREIAQVAAVKVEA